MATIAFTGQASATPRVADSGTKSVRPAIAGGTASCSTTGARGSMGATRPSGDRWPYEEFKIALSLTDTSGDGHHVRIRLLTKPVGSQQIFTWPWHSLTTGKGDTLALSTTAQSNIAETGVEVARFEGDTKLNSCTDWT
jgi:hypothetical protein